MQLQTVAAALPTTHITRAGIYISIRYFSKTFQILSIFLFSHFLFVFLVFVLRNSIQINFPFSVRTKHRVEVVAALNEWNIVVGEMMPCFRRPHLKRKISRAILIGANMAHSLRRLSRYLLANRQINTISSLGFIRIYLCKLASRIFSHFVLQQFAAGLHWRRRWESAKRKFSKKFSRTKIASTYFVPFHSHSSRAAVDVVVAWLWIERIIPASTDEGERTRKKKAPEWKQQLQKVCSCFINDSVFSSFEEFSFQCCTVRVARAPTFFALAYRECTCKALALFCAPIRLNRCTNESWLSLRCAPLITNCTRKSYHYFHSLPALLGLSASEALGEREKNRVKEKLQRVTRLCAIEEWANERVRSEKNGTMAKQAGDSSAMEIP